ncbi:MAG: ABC transporter substrate-binding protein [bacterium]|nr:ABC transporter substrate-binding protein [bacterium]
MKKALFFSVFALFFYSSLFAQSIEMGRNLYQQGDFERAIFVLERVPGEESELLLGKSHFAQRNYLKAINILRGISDSNTEWNQDARYTMALAHFQLKNYAESLETLHGLLSESRTTAITRRADQFYNDVLGFLTDKQRFTVFKAVSEQEIQLDIIEKALGRVHYSVATALFDLYERSKSSENTLRENRIKTALSDSIQYQQSFNPNRLKTAPDGISYNIGVVLPQFEFDATEYEIPQHLYYGIQLAVEQFNQENPNKKAFITYRNTNQEGSSTVSILADLVYKEGIDVLIGPLFSEVAKEFSNLAEAYEIPMLLPLANADSLDLYNNFVFQLNPSFATQGKIMARKAVKELGYDTLGVIAEAQSLGAPAARAFRHEAERLGGYVEYYFEEDFESLGYDIRDYTQFFTTDTLDSVAMVKAVYAPFTGSIAQTLIESMLTDLEAMRSKVAILGSEEWREVNIESRRLDSTQLYFSRSFNVDTSTSDARKFISEFRIRFSTVPNDFAFIGYDAASVILEQLDFVNNPADLRDSLKDLRGYKGLSIDVSFNGTHVNEKISIERMIRDYERVFVAQPGQSQQNRRRR